MAIGFSFMVDGQWAPERTGEYDLDCAVGRQCAQEVIEAIQGSGNPALFGTVARAITAAGRYEAVEIGFCSVIGITIVAAA